MAASALSDIHGRSGALNGGQLVIQIVGQALDQNLEHPDLAGNDARAAEKRGIGSLAAPA